jgi:hypothetical protein
MLSCKSIIMIFQKIIEKIMSSIKHSYFSFGLILAIGLVVSSYLISDTLRDVKSENQTITVKGYAEKDIVSDLAIWYCTVSATMPDLASAYNKLEYDFNQAKKYILENGFKESELEIGRVSSIKNYEWIDYKRTDNVIGYTVERSLSIESSDINMIKDISINSSELIKEGIEFHSNHPQYLYTKLDDLKIEMLAAATRDARERAETLAENSGSKVGNLQSARQGVFQITSQNSEEVSDYGIFNTASIEKTIKSVVTMEFKIK